MSNLKEVMKSQQCAICRVVAQQFWYCLEDPGGKIYQRLCIKCAFRT
jgi:hypothetical protein